jgi:hypothetical protein
VILAIKENFILKIKNKALDNNNHEEIDKVTEIQEQEIEEPNKR